MDVLRVGAADDAWESGFRLPIGALPQHARK